MDLLFTKRTKKKTQVGFLLCTGTTTGITINGIRRVGKVNMNRSMFSRRIRLWACSGYNRISKKTVSSLVTLAALIVSTWFQPPVAAAPNNNNISPVGSTPYNSGSGGYGNNNGHSNITLLDLYPELKDYLWKKALSQITPQQPSIPTSTEDYSSNYNYNGNSDSFNLAALQQQVQALLQQNSNQNYQQNPWGYDNTPGSFSNINNNNANLLNANVPGTVGSVGSGGGGGGISNSGFYGGVIGQGQSGFMNSRGDLIDSDTANTYNYEKEVLKHFHPFGTPEFWESWKFKPSPVPSVGWTNTYPVWEEEPEYGHHHVGYEHEVSTKDFSCLAGLLGLKTLKKLKISTILSKLKYIGIFLIAFKLGVLLSPIAIPLLFPIILLVTVVKILPLILIIVLLLKLLKKQIKIKKPFGKFLDRTGSLFFDDMDFVTEKVLSSEENVEKISRDITKKSSVRRRKGRVNAEKLKAEEKAG